MNEEIVTGITEIVGWESFFNKPKNINLSVIIATYKNTKYIDECINSIIESSENYSIEILIGIDSCLETLNYVKSRSYPDFVKFYFIKNNIGPYVIKNSLVQISNSDNLLFFDSDDIMTKSTIGEVFENLKFYDCIRLKYQTYTNGKIGDNKNRFGEGVIGINKNLFLNMNGYEPWMCAADSDFMGRLYKRRPRLYHTKGTAFYYRQHPTSLTKRSDTGMASHLRHSYWTLRKTKKGKPVKLHTIDFESVDVVSYEIPNDFKYDNFVNKEKIKTVLNPTPRKIIDKKIIKSDPVVINNLELLSTNKPDLLRVIKTNKPENRQELINNKVNLKNTVTTFFPKKINNREGKNYVSFGKK